MHLWQEGTGKMIMYQILRIMIYEENFFSLDTLNDFIDRLPIAIVDKHLRLATMNISSNKESNLFFFLINRFISILGNKHGKLKPLIFAQNAAETMFFIRMFGFIVAQLIGDHEENIFRVHRYIFFLGFLYGKLNFRMTNSAIFGLWIKLVKFQSFLFSPKMPYTEVSRLAARYEDLFSTVDAILPDLQKIFKNHLEVHLEEVFFLHKKGKKSPMEQEYLV